MHQIERTKCTHDTLNRYDKKKYEKICTLRKKFWFCQRKLEKGQPLESFTNNLFNSYLTLTKRKYFSLEKSKKLINSATTTG